METKAKAKIAVMVAVLQHASHFPDALPMFGEKFTVPPLCGDEVQATLRELQGLGVLRLARVEVEEPECYEMTSVIFPWLETHSRLLEELRQRQSRE